VFALAFGDRVSAVQGVTYLDYIVPGLIMMAVIQNAFANTSSSIIISKIQGNIVDVLMPPISPAELTAAYALGGATRGLMVAVIVVAAMAPIASIGLTHAFAALFFAVAASLMLSLVGLATGIWADKFDHIATVTNFVITPLAFLSGTFYSVRDLPDVWITVSHFDPFFYAIDGFRYGMLGISDSNLWLGAAVLITVNVVLWVLCHQMFVRGYKLKS
jgi:ABC-2 type transport system permease protein